MSNVDALLVTFAREKHAVLFRQAASRLRQGLDPIEQYRIQEECGRLVIEADELGYLPAIPELRKLIDWHTGDGVEDRKPGIQAVKVRCPANLFLDVAGGHLVRVRRQGEKWAIVEDPRRGTSRHGGLIPSYLPAILRMPDGERQAEACEWLAELIERHDGAAPQAQHGDPGVRSSNLSTPLRENPPEDDPIPVKVVSASYALSRQEKQSIFSDDERVIADALAVSGYTLEAVFVRQFKNRETLTWQEIVEAVCPGEDREWATVKTWVNRVKNALIDVDPHCRLSFSTSQRGFLVIKRPLPE